MLFWGHSVGVQYVQLQSCRCIVKPKLHYFDLFWICFTTYKLQQIEVTELGLRPKRGLLLEPVTNCSPINCRGEKF